MMDAKQLDDFKELAYESLDEMAVALSEYKAMGFLNRKSPIDDEEMEDEIFSREGNFIRAGNKLHAELTRLSSNRNLVPLLVTQANMLAHMIVWLSDLIRMTTDKAMKGDSDCKVSDRLRQIHAKFREYVLSFISQIEVETAIWNLLLGKMNADDIKTMCDRSAKMLADMLGNGVLKVHLDNQKGE